MEGFQTARGAAGYRRTHRLRDDIMTVHMHNYAFIVTAFCLCFQAVAFLTAFTVEGTFAVLLGLSTGAESYNGL